jgi:hypothetical protein
MKNTKTVSFSELLGYYRTAQKLSALATASAAEVEHSLLSESPSNFDGKLDSTSFFDRSEALAEKSKKDSDAALVAIKNYKIQSWIFANPGK